MRNIILCCLFVCVAGVLYAAPPNDVKPLPALPEVLQAVRPSPRSHEGAKGAELVMKEGVLGIHLNSARRLTPQQWDTVASLHPRAFFFNDQALTDSDMDRLVALDPQRVELRITPLTDEGAAKFAQMLHLKRLVSHHLLAPTPKTDELLAKHPTLEEFRSAGAFGIGALRSPKLKSVELAQEAATKARVEELATHTQLEELSLFAHNVPTVDADCLASVAKIKTLKTLRLSFTVLTFEDGLKPLLDLPSLTELSLYMSDVSETDLAKFKAAMPNVVVKNIRPMTPEYRTKWDKMTGQTSREGGKK
jgi:hypothetical protein